MLLLAEVLLHRGWDAYLVRPGFSETYSKTPGGCRYGQTVKGTLLYGLSGSLVRGLAALKLIRALKGGPGQRARLPLL